MIKFFFRSKTILLLAVLILAACQPAEGSDDEPPTIEAQREPTLAPTERPTEAQTTITPTPLTPSVTPQPATPTALPEATSTTAPDDLSLTADQVRLYPVPFIISGDRVTFQIQPYVPEQVTVRDVDVEIYINDQLINAGKLNSRNWAGQAEGIYDWAWNTQGQFGEQTVRIVLDGQDLIAEGDRNPDNNEAVFTVDVRGVGHRPLEERDATWVTAETDCCKVTILTRTAAYRDLPELLEEVEYAVAQAAIQLKEEPNEKIEVFFIDKTIGQGGYAGSEMAVTYVDRAYAGGNLHELLVHEAVHIIDRQFAPQRIKFLAEGTAVWATGGHYKLEDLNQRAAALAASGQYMPLSDLVDEFYTAQHEIGYLQAGAFVTYLVDQFGYATFREFYADTNANDAAADAEALDQNLQTYYGSSLAELETEWLSYLGALVIDQTDIDDLNTTIRYYEVMREYQQAYDPTAHFLSAWLPSPLDVQAHGNPADLIRHPQQEINVTLEVMLKNAESALNAFDHVRANVILDSIERILAEDGAFADPLSSSYLAIVRVATNFGYEVQNIDLQGDKAKVLATSASGVRLTELDFEQQRGDWILLSK